MRETDDGSLLLRNSERVTYLRCRQKWEWGWLQGWTPKVAAPALRFGTLIHEALAAYYKPGKRRGPHPAKTFRKMYDEELEEVSRFGFRDEDGEWQDAGVMGIDMLEHYVEHYRGDPHIEVIAPEQPFRVDLSKSNGKGYLVTPVGTFDAIIRNLETGKIGLFEHKTATAISTAHLSLDEQAGTYHALAGSWLHEQGLLKKGEEIDFILYNYLRKALRDDRPRNEAGQYLNKPTKADLFEAADELFVETHPKMTLEQLRQAYVDAGEDPDLHGQVSKSQPPPYFEREPVWRDEHDREQLLFRIRAQAWEMKEATEGRLPIYKRPTPGCSGGMGESKCAFFDVCELHETGSDWEEMMELTLTRWDPYEAPYDRNIPAGL